MKICFLNHDLKDSTGAGRFGLNLVRRLESADENIEATVLTSLSSGHRDEEALLHKNPFRLLFSLPAIRRAFRESAIIHALDGWPYGAIAAIASFGLGKPLFITAIGTGAVQPLYGWRRGIMAWAYRRADRIVAVSRHTRDEILERVPGLAIEVINHGVDAEEWGGDQAAGLSEMEKSGIEKLKPYILSVGGWKKRKGFEYSFPAFAEISKKFQNLKYVVCGIGPKPALTEPLGITDRAVYFKGVPRQFLAALYRNAELFLLLPVDDGKDIEGFGFAFLEAAAAGLPVVGTRQSSAEDAVAEGENGLLVPPRDAVAAAEAATRILADPGLSQRFSAGSRTFAGRMNWTDVIGRYRRMYQSVRGEARR